MEIRKGTPADLEAIMEVIDKARAFMRAHGNTVQWVNGYPSRELFLSDMEADVCYVVTEAGAVHGVFAMIPGDDPFYGRIDDGTWPDDEPYLAIHRVGSDGVLSGMTDAITAFAAQHCDRLRADTHKVNLPMQNALKKAGFSRRGIIYVGDGTPREAFARISAPEQD